MKTKLTFIVAVLMMTTLQFSAFSATTPGDEPAAPMTEAELNTAIVDLSARVDVLKEAKKNATTQAEKKQIRSEIRDIKKEAKQLKQQANGGIYIGAGALLVLVIVLLLL